MSKQSAASGEESAGGIFAPLGHLTFRNMWISSTVTYAGSLVQSVAAAWVMADIASADYVALVQTATFLPMALFALPAGAIADIYDRRKVQMAFFSLSMIAAVLMTAASALGWITPWILLALCFLVGTGGALSAPARGASVGEQVPPALMAQAVALNNISYNLARSIGPALGGILVAAFGATTAFALNALSHLPTLESLRRWNRVAEISRMPPESFLRSISSGLRYIVHLQSVRRTILRAFVICFIGAALQSLLPLIARDLLGGDAKVFGLMLGCFGVGAVSGIFVLQLTREVLGNETTMRLCSVVLAACLAILALSSSMLLDFVVLLIAGMAWMITTTLISITVQLFVPRWVMGRAIATSTAAISLGISLGAWFWGVVAHQHGVVVTFQLAALAMLVSLLLGRYLPIPDRSASTEVDEKILTDPDVALGISGRSGPIGIELQYFIPAEKARDFYNLMREMQRMRLRNGAYDWSISRNIADPDLWLERFSCPTWDDYLRLRNRRTVEDAALQNRAHEMHIGIEPIKVRRWLERPFGSVRWRQEAPDRGDETLRIQS
ncbi:MAG: MFS transporter [Spongiibacteraceae bacterium]